MIKVVKVIHKIISFPPMLVFGTIVIILAHRALNADIKANGNPPINFAQFMVQYKDDLLEILNSISDAPYASELFFVIGILFWALIFKIIFL